MRSAGHCHEHALEAGYQIHLVYIPTGFPCSVLPTRSVHSAAGSRSTVAGKGRWPDPALYKTVICRNWRSGDCSYGGRCAFAHGADELRQVRTAAI